MTAERIVVINRIELCFAAVVGLGVIAAAGVGIGILFALNSGVETRKNIKNKAVTTVEAIMSIARKKSKTVKDSAAQATQDVVSDVSGVLRVS
ncbi:MAG TPA: YtxH domain-containing protein [Desulfosporosinus sp.]|nr:YtxH domain-containing protein [Desulfosporosinus sp.]